MSEILKRLITGIELVLIVIFLPIFSEVITNIVILILSIIGLLEFYTSYKDEELNKYIFIPILFTIIYFMTMYFKDKHQELVIALFIISTLSIPIFKESLNRHTIPILLKGFFYISFLFYNLAELPKEYFWLVFIISFGTDTFAYLGGKLFGKHKLSPKVSPNKTIEGSISGILGAIILFIIYSYLVLDNFKIIYLFPIIVASILGQLGDLVASKIKRFNDIKDFGKFFPGHGGVLDRFDSVLFVAPIVRLFFSFF